MLRELQRLTWGALAEMRTVLVELHPAALTEGDLRELLQQLARATTARAPLLEVTVDVEGERRPPPEVQVVLYRVAQEALNNVLKHAQASQAHVTLGREGNWLELRVEDDGRGTQAEYHSPRSLGLVGMRERVEAIGGQLSIDSEPGGGTRVRVVWDDAPAPASDG